jgi:hypothetical protein
MAKEQSIAIAIPKINVQQMEIVLVGDSPLISHAWSAKAKKEMLDKQMKKAKAQKEAKDPWRDYCDSLYWLTARPEKATEKDIAKAKFGFPCVAFKAAAVGACRFAEIKMTEARGAFHVVGEFAHIQGTPEIREDMVRVGMGTADIRYRGEFKQWQTALVVSYNGDALSPEQIVNLFNVAGFGVGVGEWRPEKDGSYGRFHVKAHGE